MARDITNELTGPDHVHAAAVKPADVRELSLRSILCGLAVAAVMGASYPYIVLKLGFGPNVSVVAAFFGYLALGIVFLTYLLPKLASLLKSTSREVPVRVSRRVSRSLSTSQ